MSSYDHTSSVWDLASRKRIGQGLLEAFSETCEVCQGRGLIVHHEPIEPKKKQEEEQTTGISIHQLS